MSNPNSRDQMWQDRQMHDGLQALERTSASLARSNQIAIETEHIGTEVIGNLGEQRESLLRSQRRLEGANDGLTKSNSILRRMQRNVCLNKVLLVAIIVMELLILMTLVFLKFVKS